MDSLKNIEYRGYSTYEIDSLTNSGQAEALGHGPGREGAYKWIDAFYDIKCRKRDNIIYPKPDNKDFQQILETNEKLYQMRRAEAQVR